MRGVQSRRVRGEQAQLFCTRAHWVMQRFCTILPVYLAHFSRSRDHITRLCNLSALIQQALCSRGFISTRLASRVRFLYSKTSAQFKLFMDWFSEWSAITNLGNLTILGNFSGFRRGRRRGIRHPIWADFFRDDLSRYVSFLCSLSKRISFRPSWVFCLAPKSRFRNFQASAKT